MLALAMRPVTTDDTFNEKKTIGHAYTPMETIEPSTDSASYVMTQPQPTNGADPHF
jgi:hypothetical protein